MSHHQGNACPVEQPRVRVSPNLATDTNGGLLVIAVKADDIIDYGMKARTVRGVSRVLMRLTPTGESQSNATYYLRVDAGGRIPLFVMRSKIPQALGVAGYLRDQFQRDDEIDTLERDELARIIKDEPQTTPPRKMASLEDCTGQRTCSWRCWRALCACG